MIAPDLATLVAGAVLDGTALVLPMSWTTTTICRCRTAAGDFKSPDHRLAAHGLTAMMASNWSFICSRTATATPRTSIFKISRRTVVLSRTTISHRLPEEPIMRAIRTQLEAAGVLVENTKGEWGPGQGEINIRYADALTMADRHVFLENALRKSPMVSARRSPLWPNGAPIWPAVLPHPPKLGRRERRRAFHDPVGDRGMSAMMARFLAGQMTYAN